MDEMFVRVGGKQMYLWRAVDAEGEVLDVLLQAKRDKRAAQKLMRKLLKRQGMGPDEWVTDKCLAYGAALRELKHAQPVQSTRSANSPQNSYMASARARTLDPLIKSQLLVAIATKRYGRQESDARHTHAKPSSCSSCCVQLRGWADHSLVRVTSALIVPLAIASTTFGERKARGSWTRR